MLCDFTAPQKPTGHKVKLIRLNYKTIGNPLENYTSKPITFSAYQTKLRINNLSETIE